MPEKFRNPRLTGDSCTIPALANTHSHAFHRALRARTHADGGTFWTWRDQMYDVAARLTPDTYYALARATYAEMAAAGIGAVGEFHYLHHQADGTPYADPNEMGRALLAAADDVGIRIRLLDTCYLAAGIGREPEGVQLRFSDGTVEAWAERVAAFDDDRVGVAIHSVRAVPREALSVVADVAAGRPLHVHLSEQPAENEQCLQAYGLTPTELLAEAGALGPATSVVHATHLTDRDVELLGTSGCFASFCPTTERDLADGIGPARALTDAGVPITLGSDSHAVIDIFEEMRAVELHERLATLRRGHWSADELLAMATGHGYASLGFHLAFETDADTVTIDPMSPRTAGTGDGAPVYAATAADVTRLEVAGRVVFDGDREQVGRDLDAAITAVLA